jgi:uracil-DNA glycosylase family 4
MSHLHPHRSDDDQIFQKYLDRAISQINELSTAIATCDLCEHAPGFSHVVGTGHPLADVFLLKFAPQSSELDEGVAFFGRAGEAILKSVQRLNVDPLDLYGTNCVKCSDAPSACMVDRCPTWLGREIGIVGPKLLVVMGERALEVVNALGVTDASMLEWAPGVVQRWTHTCDAIVCPDIDDSVEGGAAKQAFWQAFRQVGAWYDQRPPW